MRKKYSLMLAFASICLLSCSKVETTDTEYTFADENLEPMTRRVYEFLDSLQGNHLLYGQQSVFTIGYNWFFDGVPDVYQISGDYPVIFGKDARSILGKSTRWEENRTEMLRAMQMGGITTFSWHAYNPYTEKGTRDTVKNSVREILPGGKGHALFRSRLDSIATFAKTLYIDSLKQHIPVLFRPFHEHTGHWFWWGEAHNDPEDIRSLWRFTVDYLTKEKGVHNFLFVYSTDTVGTREQYLASYPGDEYIDILGMDIYRDVEQNDRDGFIRKLQLLSDIAEEKDKLCALTETGYANHEVEDWWTDFLLAAIDHDSATRKISWVLTWSNYREDMYWSVPPGHPEVDNFLKFKNNERVLFASEVEDNWIYKF